MSKQLEKERQFIAQALPVFMRFGIKSVTMDDMARRLGMSKKTVYTFVKDKNDLVKKALTFQHLAEKEIIEGICSKNYNAIDEMFEIGHFISGILSDIHPSIHYDLEKYHKEVFNELLEAHESVIYECISSNLKKGMEEGLYREDLNVMVISKLYTKRIDNVFDSELFPPEQISFKEVYAIMFRYHILGVASPKGTRYLSKKWEKITSDIL